MKAGNVVLIGGGLYAAYYFSQLGVAANTVDIVFAGVSINSITEYVVKMSVRNVSNVSVTVNSMAGKVYVNGSELADMKMFTPIVATANAETMINVICHPSILNIPQIIKDIANLHGQALNFSIQGNANLNGMVIPFEVEKSISF